MDSLLSFPVGLFHPLQHAGLSRRSPSETVIRPESTPSADPRATPEEPNYFRRTASSALAPRLDQGKQSDSLPTPCGIASVKVMRIPCSGRKITIGRASIVWPGTKRKSYFLSRTLRIMRICSMA